MVEALIIHHSSDIDGYGSASVAIQFLENQKFYIKTKTVPINYNVYDFNRIKKIILDIKQKNYLWVFIVDFSLSSDETKWIIDNCDKLFWCDHHSSDELISTIEEVQQYLVENNQKIYQTAVINDRRKNYFFKFDLNRDNPEKAAILLTYEMLFPNDPPNKYVQYISNLDLWKLDEIKIVNFREFIHKLPWKNYKKLKHFIFNGTIHKSKIPKEVVDELIDVFGSTFLSKKKQQIEKISSRFVFGKFHNYTCCVINNTNSEINSELLNYMCMNGVDIAMSYYDDLINDVRGFSLRTMRDDINLTEIASSLNGGGHKKASGFSLPLEKGIKLVNEIIY